MSEIPGRDEFAELIGTEFTIKPPDGSILTAVLLSVSELRSRGVQELFSMIFEIASAEDLEQSIYEIEHPSLLPLALFLVPVAKRKRPADAGRIQQS